MITLIDGLPDDVVGARYSGTVSTDDYKNVLVPAIETLVKADKPINLLIVIDDDFDHLALGARMRDSMLEHKYRNLYGRIAVVCDEEAVAEKVRKFAEHKDNLVRVYPSSEEEQAKNWATGLGD